MMTLAAIPDVAMLQAQLASLLADRQSLAQCAEIEAALLCAQGSAGTFAGAAEKLAAREGEVAGLRARISAVELYGAIAELRRHRAEFRALVSREASIESELATYADVDAVVRYDWGEREWSTALPGAVGLPPYKPQPDEPSDDRRTAYDSLKSELPRLRHQMDTSRDQSTCLVRQFPALGLVED